MQVTSLSKLLTLAFMAVNTLSQQHNDVTPGALKHQGLFRDIYNYWVYWDYWCM